MKVKNDFVMREIGDDYVLVPTGIEALEFGGLITTNDVGAFLWEQLMEDITMEELVQRLVKEFEVEEEVAVVDVKEFVATLKELQILVK